MDQPRLYADLASLWPILSPIEEYEEEAVLLRAALDEHLREGTGSGRPSLLDLGTGGGHHLHALLGHFDATAVDASEAMLALSKDRHPTVEHVVGDLRSVRLARTFDAVLIPPGDTTVEVVMLFVIREGARVRVEQDRHVQGLFPRATWFAALDRAGFEVQERPFVGQDGSALSLLVGLRR
jgi:SAM-dependent methyltransferase